MSVLPVLSLWFGCAPPPALPDPEVPPHTRVMREVLVGRGPERTGNRREALDVAGCYRAAANSWLWVTDPVLAASPDPSLHWNRDLPAEPDFCLSPSERPGVEWAAAVAWLRWSRTQPPDPARTDLVERWTVIIGGEARSRVLPYGGSDDGVVFLRGAWLELATGGVWGQSPEERGSSGRSMASVGAVLGRGRP